MTLKNIEGKYFTTANYDKFTSDIRDVKTEQKEFVNKSYIDEKLININKKFNSNKAKHKEADKTLANLTKIVAEISENRYDLLLGRMYFRGDNGYQNILVFASMLSSLVLHSNRKVTNWILTGISYEKIKAFEPTMSNLANDIVNLKFNNSVLVQISFSSLDSNFILTLYIVYELNTWPRYPSNKFTLKIVYLVQSN